MFTARLIQADKSFVKKMLDKIAARNCFSLKFWKILKIYLINSIHRRPFRYVLAGIFVYFILLVFHCHRCKGRCFFLRLVRFAINVV